MKKVFILFDRSANAFEEQVFVLPSVMVLARNLLDNEFVRKHVSDFYIKQIGEFNSSDSPNGTIVLFEDEDVQVFELSDMLKVVSQDESKE